MSIVRPSLLAEFSYCEVFDDRWHKELEDSFLNHRRSDFEIECDESAVRSIPHNFDISNCLAPELGGIGERSFVFAT